MRNQTKTFDCPYCDNEAQQKLPPRDAYVHLLLEHRDELPEHWQDVVEACTITDALYPGDSP